MAFATVEHVETRLGRPLTTEEEAMAEQVIETVTGLIVEAVNKTTAWATALSPVPAYFKALCIDKVIQVGSNPNALRSETKTLGAASHSKTYTDESGDVFLTDEEERRCRRVVWGRTSASTMIGTHFQEVE